MRDLFKGLGLAVATCVALAFVPEDQARDVVAILLTVIAAVYVGFALAPNSRLATARQVTACAFFAVLALLGLWVSWWFLVAGLALHAGWDYLHHGKGGAGAVPRWYVPFCVAYDLPVALFVAVYFAMAI